MKKYFLIILIITLIMFSIIIVDFALHKKDKNQLTIVVANYMENPVNGTIIISELDNDILLEENFSLGELFSPDDGIKYYLNLSEDDYILAISTDNNLTLKRIIHMYYLPTTYIFQIRDDGIKEPEIAI